MAATERRDTRWWRAPEGEVNRALVARLRSIRTSQTARRSMYAFFAQLYGTTELDAMGLAPMTDGDAAFVPPTAPRNVVRGGIETVVARIGRDHPLPQVYTSEGTYAEQRKAERMSMAIEGGFQNLKVFWETKRCLRDGCLFSLGILKVDDDGESPTIERVFPWELDVDRSDAVYGKPRSIYQTKWYDRDVLAELVEEWVGREKFEELELGEKIQKAKNLDVGNDNSAAWGTDDATEMRIQVVQAWHLPSSKTSKDGMHAIVIDGADLFVEEYTERRFPFAFFRYKDALAGLHGDALAVELAGWQMELNFMGERVRDSHWMNAAPAWLVPEGSDVLETDITNGLATQIRYRQGFRPEQVVPVPLHPATYQYLESLTPGAYADAGISQLSATSQRPSGEWSGTALDALDDAESGRFNSVSENWENFHIEVGELLLAAYARLAKKDKNLVVKLYRRKGAKALRWSDFALDPDEITVSVYSTNALAKTPQSRQKQLFQLFNAKVIDRDLFMRLNGNPDLESENDLVASLRLLADEQIEWMLDADDPDADDAYQQPVPLQDVIYALHRAQAHWCFGRMRGLNAGTLSLLEQYMEDCKAILKSMADEAAAAAAPAPGAPAGMPGPGGPPPGVSIPGAGAPSPMPGGAPPGMPPMAGAA